MSRLSCAATLSSVLVVACGGPSANAPATASPAPSAPPAVAAPAPTAAPSTGEPAPPPPPKPALADLEKKAIADFYAAFNEHDIKKLGALYDENAVSAAPGPGGWMEVRGAEAIAAEFSRPFSAMPDLKAAPIRVYQKNDVVVVEWAATGTNTAGLMGAPPTNKKAAVWGASVYWFNGEGRITRDEEFHDQATILQQLGAMPGKARELATMPSGDATWIASASSPDEDALVEQMKATWPATWNKHDAKAYAKVITDDALHSEIASPNDYKGKDAAIKECEMYVKATPDMNIAVDRAWGFAPNVVVAEFTFTGTMKGNIGPFKATNKPITIHGLDVDELKDGKMRKAVTYSNGMELLAALGVLPKSGAHGKPVADKPGDAKKSEASQTAPAATRP